MVIDHLETDLHTWQRTGKPHSCEEESISEGVSTESRESTEPHVGAGLAMQYVASNKVGLVMQYVASNIYI